MNTVVSHKAYPHRPSLPKLMLVMPVLVLGMKLASATTADLSYFLLAAYALTGRAQAIQALFMSWFITMINPGLVPSASYVVTSYNTLIMTASQSALSAIGRYAVIAGATISVILRYRPVGNRLTVNTAVLSTIVLGAFLIMHALLVSAYPDVSLLKSISFSVTFVTLLSAWSGLPPDQRKQTERFVLYSMAILAFASLPLLLTGLGYLRNGTGFQGVLGHPQAFGPFVALLAAWLGGRFLSEKSVPAWQIALFALCPFLILTTEARTAGGAMALGLTLPLLFIFLFRAHKTKALLPGIFTGRFVLALWVGFIALIAFGTIVFAQLDNYILKSGRSTGTDLRSAYQVSRGLLIEDMIYNIEKNPMGGIGFGIASIPQSMVVKRDPFFGLPLSAAVEKGVLPVAIVEELGFPGAFFVFAWIFVLFRQAGRGGYTALAVLTTALMTNLGESTLFSIGGMGMLVLLLTSWAVTAKRHKQK